MNLDFCFNIAAFICINLHYTIIEIFLKNSFNYQCCFQYLLSSTCEYMFANCALPLLL